MQLVSNAWHVMSAGAVLVGGAVLCVWLSRLFDMSSRRALGLYLWHSAFCLVYIGYVLTVGGDALSYYRASLSGYVDFTLGTAAVEALTVLFSSVLGMSLLGTFLGYNLLGTIGLLAVDASFQEAVRDRPRWVARVATVMVLLPSVSFWSSAIGKDSVSFLAAGLVLWSARDLRRHVPLMATGILIMLLVRPHIATLIVAALAVSMLFRSHAGVVQRVGITALALAATATMVPLAIRMAGLGQGADMADVVAYIEDRQFYNLDSGSSIDISTMTLPMKLFTYLFRPLPFEAHNIPALAASLDNVMLLMLVVAGFWALLTPRGALAGTANRPFMWAYVLFTWVLLALTTANLGISVRQKWMFLPMLVYLLLTLLGRPRRITAAVEGVQAGRGQARTPPP